MCLGEICPSPSRNKGNLICVQDPFLSGGTGDTKMVVMVGTQMSHDTGSGTKFCNGGKTPYETLFISHRYSNTGVLND